MSRRRKRAICGSGNLLEGLERGARSRGRYFSSGDVSNREGADLHTKSGWSLDSDNAAVRSRLRPSRDLPEAPLQKEREDRLTPKLSRGARR